METNAESILSFDTDETRSNNPGAGRGLGQVYDALGRRLENAVNRYGQRRGWKGNWERYATRNPSEVSYNATAPNLVGPGRTLDLLITKLGQMLEDRMNIIASTLGMGPEALHRQIYDQFMSGFGNGVYGLSPVTNEGRREFLRVQRLLGKTVFIKRCSRLLQYIHSDVFVNQASALSAVSSLIFLDPYLKQLFLELGGYEAVMTLQPRIAQYPNGERELLQSASRKALLDYSETRCNAVAKEVHDIPLLLNGASIAVKEIIETKIVQIVNFIDVRDLDVTYIAMRHLANFMPKRMRMFETIQDNFENSILELLGVKLVTVAAQGFTGLDWESVDELVRNCLFRSENVLWKRSTSGIVVQSQRLDPWAMIIGFVFRWPELMPRTGAHILYTVDEEYRFLNFSSDWISPGQSPLLQLALKYVSSDESNPMTLSDVLSRAAFPEKSGMSKGYERRVRESISSLSDAALSEALLERRIPNDIGHLPVTDFMVPRIENVRIAIAKLIRISVAAITKSEKRQTWENIAYLCHVDRYCKRAVLYSLDDALREQAVDPSYRREIEKIIRFVDKPKETIFAKGRILERENVFSEKHFVLYRHIVRHDPVCGAGAIHLRNYAPFGRQLMCMICLMSGDLSVFDDSAPVCDALRIGHDDVLWLPIRENDTFVVNSDDHDYVLAGILEEATPEPGIVLERRCRRRYVAIAVDSTGVPQWCTVQDGDREVWYYEKTSIRVSVGRFFVMTLRHNLSSGRKRALIMRVNDGMQKRTRDSTGPLGWERFEEKSVGNDLGGGTGFQ